MDHRGGETVSRASVSGPAAGDHQRHDERDLDHGDRDGRTSDRTVRRPVRDHLGVVHAASTAAPRIPPPRAPARARFAAQVAASARTATTGTRSARRAELIATTPRVSQPRLLQAGRARAAPGPDQSEERSRGSRSAGRSAAVRSARFRRASALARSLSSDRQPGRHRTDPFAQRSAARSSSATAPRALPRWACVSPTAAARTPPELRSAAGAAFHAPRGSRARRTEGRRSSNRCASVTASRR